MGNVNVYRSSDASAPSLNGNNGSLVALLDAVLVNGYGSVAGAGWAIAYSATNKRVYRNSAVTGTGMYLYVDDSGPGGAGSAEARMTGFQAATGLGTGSGQFPTYSQLNIGIGSVVCRKSASNNSTTRAWTVVADETVFYLFTETGDYNSPTLPSFFMFGDYFSYSSTDAYKCAIIGRNQDNNNSSAAEWSPCLNGHLYNGGGQWTILGATLCGHFTASNSFGVGGSLQFGKHTDMVKMSAFGYGSYTGTTNSNVGNAISPIGSNWAFPYEPMQVPNPVDSGIYMAPLWIHHNGALRGYFKGLWCPMHHLPLNHNDTFSGTGAFSGKSFLAQTLWGNNGGSQNYPGQIFVETSTTWS